MGRQRRGFQRGGRNFDHDPDLQARGSGPGLRDGVVEQLSRGEQLVECADHREHHADGGVLCHQRHRQQLVGQQLWVLQRHSDAADAQERVELGGPGRELQRLVPPDVEGAQRDPPSVESFGDLAVDGHLFVDAGCVRPAEKQEFGPDQPGEVGAVRGGGPRVVDRADVGADADGDAVGRDGGPVRPGVGGAATFLERMHLLEEPGADVGGRVDEVLAAGAVDGNGGAVGDRQHVGSGTDNRGNVLGAQQDHVVGVGTAVCHQHRDHLRRVQFGSFAGGQVVGDQHAAARGSRRDAEHRPQHLVTDGGDVGGAGLQVRVGQGGEPARQCADRGRPTGGGRRAVIDAGAGGVEQFGVVEQQEVGVEDPCLGLSDVAGGVGALSADVATDGGDRLAQPSPLGHRVGGGFVGHVDGTPPGRAGRADAQPRHRADGLPGRGRVRHCSGRFGGFVEIAGGQRQHVFERLGGPPARDPQLDGVAFPDAQRRDLGKACGVDPFGVGAHIAQVDAGVAVTHLVYQPGGGAGVQAVRVLDGEGADQTVVDRSARGAGVGGLTQLSGLAGQGPAGLGDDLVDRGPTGGGHRGDHQTLDQRRRAQHHPIASIVVEQLQGEFGRQHGAAQIHQHHHAGTLVGGGDGVDDLRSIGAEGGFVEACGDGDAKLLAVHHLLGQRDRGASQRSAVRDDNQPDGRHGGHAPNAVAAAPISMADEAAPGSMCPTLRWPR